MIFGIRVSIVEVGVGVSDFLFKVVVVADAGLLGLENGIACNFWHLSIIKGTRFASRVI